MTASFITLGTGEKVATETFNQSGQTVHLQKFLATNPLGQANAYGAGAADAATPRFTLASDDAGVAAIVTAIEAIPGGGGGGGTEYTEDAAAAANPAGGAVLLRRRDTLSSETSANGDWVAQNATDKGEAYVKDADAATALGGLTETAPATDTASSGLNGRLQRIAQRITSLIALVPASLGQKTKSASFAVALASDDDLVAAVGPQAATAASSDTGTFSLIALVKRALTHLAALVLNTGAAEYEVVEASQADQMCGSTGAAGDELRGLLVIPTSLSPGAVSIEDGSTNTTVFAGGTDSVATKIPFFIDLQGIKTVNGGWEITTGADVRVIAFGNFT